MFKKSINSAIRNEEAGKLKSDIKIGLKLQPKRDAKIGYKVGPITVATALISHKFSLLLR